ncbi:HugZ family protein [Afifella sp. IM 167]|uniref:HugZ family pyridoxamine 5'-phosphate oxidase n=1 Tax=Afifella sp. IM 167 TaxID=2033586 RepID=UPI001CCE35F0|nr:DUF2470 domain-containing protein [Afifella sp. IM 167]MBZ8131911.1 pyridoxamine 5'-phosphate oxidase [Afifella sp. IM 167]
MAKDRAEIVRRADEEARALARRLVRTARFGALAVVEPETGHPLASRTALATDMDGAPIILISELSTHRLALDGDARCSLLVGEPGRGDPLAHARLTLIGRARQIGKNTDEYARIRRRYLARQPKASLYVDFGDFAFFRIEPERASLNGGFGKAFFLEREDLLLPEGPVAALASFEEGAVNHMNADHADAIALYARFLCKVKEPDEGWQIATLDPEGLDLVAGESIVRLVFPKVVESVEGYRPILVELSKEARARQAEAAAQ